MAKITVADNCPVICRGLRNLFAGTVNLQVHSEAHNEGELLKLVGKGSFELLILEIELAGPERGLALLQRILDISAGIRVLIYTVNEDAHFAVRALKSGATGYVLKRSAEEEVLSAVRTVQGGTKYVAQKLALLQCSKNDSQFPLELLSNRELHVFEGIALGKPLVQIAQELCISPKSITSYRARVLEKLRVSSNAQLSQFAVDHAPYLFSKLSADTCRARMGSSVMRFGSA